MTKHLKIILTKMCEWVDADVNTLDFSEQEWYHKYTWADEQQNEFKAWMINYLKTNKEARYELMAFPNTDKKRIEKLVDEFIFNYGWVGKE